MAGAGARGMLGEAFGMTPDHPEFAAMREEFFLNYESEMTTRTLVFEGVAELVEKILQRNIVWGVVTNKAARFTDPLTRAIPLFAPYFERAQQMKSVGPLPGVPADPIALALGFVWSHGDVDTLIVGTSHPQQMQSNIDLVNRGLVLAEETRQALYQRFDQFDQDWIQQE
jgi:phosphoglycolate phosphatase-like HAD superfamily hydrolase